MLKAFGVFLIFELVLVCKGSSSDLVRYEPNSTEMRFDISGM